MIRKKTIYEIPTSNYVLPEAVPVNTVLFDVTTSQFYKNTQVLNLGSTWSITSPSLVLINDTTETITTLSVSGNMLTYVNEDGVSTNIDLSLYLDDTNLSRLVSGTVDSNTGIATFTRDDASTFTVDFSSLISNVDAYTKAESDTLLTDGLATKQDLLVSETNIKTINGTSLLGSGNLTISGGGASVKESFIATQGQTIITTINTLSDIEVIVNGVYSDYGWTITNTNEITFTLGLNAGDVVLIKIQ